MTSNSGQGGMTTLVAFEKGVLTINKEEALALVCPLGIARNSNTGQWLK